MSTHRCTECGRGRATIARIDAAGVTHHFHVACWRELCEWLGRFAGHVAGKETA